jgi:CDP-paratose 2-epimerase
MRILITGGAGFVGSNLAMMLASADRASSVVAFDNLHRRGSELSLEQLRNAGVEFVHGDVRLREDLAAAGPFDAMIECSAEPSVHAGYNGDPSYVLGANLIGAINCLEAARHHRASMIFLSTSRVYPIDPLRALPLEPNGTRLQIRQGATGEGWSELGISREFQLAGHRSLYGASKLAAELLVEEYRRMYGVRAIIDRCGVITGPWQMGKVDQGFVVLWAARHLWGHQLEYRGFGGAGLQVRDLLHVGDLFELVHLQLQRLDEWDGRVFNVGGGPSISVSLKELTLLAQSRAGRQVDLVEVPETAAADIPYYVTDTREVTGATGWAPRRDVPTILDDVFEWLVRHEERLKPVLTQ